MPTNLRESDLRPDSIKKNTKSCEINVVEVGSFSSKNGKMGENIKLRSVNEEQLELIKSKKVTIEMLPKEIPSEYYRRIDNLLEFISKKKQTDLPHLDFVCARHVLTTVMRSTYAYGDEKNRIPWKIIATERKEIIYLALLHVDTPAKPSKKLYPNGFQFEEFLLSDRVSSSNKNREFSELLNETEKIFKVCVGTLKGFKILYSAEVDGTNGNGLVEIKLWNGIEHPAKYFQWWLQCRLVNIEQLYLGKYITENEQSKNVKLIAIDEKNVSEFPKMEKFKV